MVDILLSPDDRFTLDSLMAKRDSIEDTLSKDMRTRALRVLSWLERARQEEHDSDAAFMFYWIAFEAVYAEWTREGRAQRANFQKILRESDSRGHEEIRSGTKSGATSPIRSWKSSPTPTYSSRSGTTTTGFRTPTTNGRNF